MVTPVHPGYTTMVTPVHPEVYPGTGELYTLRYTQVRESYTPTEVYPGVRVIHLLRYTRV